MYNADKEAQMISHKLAMVGVQLFEASKITSDTSVAEVKSASQGELTNAQSVNQLSVKSLKEKYKFLRPISTMATTISSKLQMHAMKKYVANCLLIHLKAIQEWTITLVPQQKYNLYMQELVKQGIIEEMRFAQKKFLDQLWFLENLERQGEIALERW